MRTNIKYSPDKMWYVASFVRGMSVDEAIKQLSFVLKKGAQPVKEVIMEARDIAIRNHNVEFASNMWIGKYPLFCYSVTLSIVVSFIHLSIRSRVLCWQRKGF